jgi:hypothetical protein
MKLLFGGYGHNPSTTGKQYAYWGGDNYNVGQNVVAPITNKRTGKTYNTMFTIQNTYNPQSIPGEYELKQLQGINLKTIGSKDVMQLPGAVNYDSKAQWTRASNQRYKAEQRLMSMATPTNTTQASQRLLTR